MALFSSTLAYTERPPFRFGIKYSRRRTLREISGIRLACGTSSAYLPPRAFDGRAGNGSGASMRHYKSTDAGDAYADRLPRSLNQMLQGACVELVIFGHVVRLRDAFD